MSGLYSDFIQKARLTINFFNEDSELIKKEKSRLRKIIMVEYLNYLSDINRVYFQSEDGRIMSSADLMDKSEAELKGMVSKKFNISMEDDIFYKTLAAEFSDKEVTPHDVVKRLNFAVKGLYRLSSAEKAVAELEVIVSENSDDLNDFSMIQIVKNNTELLRRIYDAFESIRTRVDARFSKNA